MKPKAILVADDDPDDIAAIKRVLGEAGVFNPVHCVSDGAEAISYLAGEGPYADRATYPHPGLLLVDLAMPRKTGLEVLDWIRKSPAPEHKVLRKIVLTGIGGHEQIHQAYLLGVHSFLIKPLRIEDIADLMNALRGMRLESEVQGRLLEFAETASEVNRDGPEI